MKLSITTSQLKLLFFLLVCVATAVGCSTSTREHQGMPSKRASDSLQTEHVYLAGLVVFPDTHPVVSKYLGHKVEPLWTPPTNAVVEALNQLPSYLLSTNKEQLAHPLYAEECLPAKENLPKSICQVIGITYKGNKGVLLNFLPANDKISTSDWRDHFIKVRDGGPRWWSVVYLRDKKQFTALHFDLGY